MDGSQNDAVLDQRTAAWLEVERGIPAEIAARCGVVTVDGMPAFEYRRNGALQYRKIRIPGPEGGKSFRRDRAGVETCLYLEHVIQDDPDPSSPLVVTEGEIDALSVAAAGIPNVVSVPDGAQLDALGEGKIDTTNDRAFSWLWDDGGLKPHIARFDRVVLAVDADRKGHILREEIAVRLERWKCSYVVFPDGCKDANDVLRMHGPDRLAAVIRDAKPLVPDRLVPLGEVPDVGTGEVFTSGLSSLDTCLQFSFMPPELCVITGEPGSGKSECAVIIGAHLAAQYRLPGAILQFEDRTRRIQETLVRFAMDRKPDGVTDRATARAWVARWFRAIEPEQSLDVDYDFAWLRDTLREARTRHGCRWVILDPWNELDHIWDRTQTESSYTNDALRKLKRIARALNLILMIVVHPSKEGGRQKEIADKDLYGIAGSAAWANKADHGIILHRPDQAQAMVYIKVAKSKDHATMGKVGLVRMEYVPGQAKYRHVGVGV